jgi:hypothetical protein
MNTDEFCKKLNEDSHKHATIPESQRYGVHFDYNDLVCRLNKVKKERDRVAGANSSLDFRAKLQPVPAKRKEKKSLTIIQTDRMPRNASVTGLPYLQTPKLKTTKFSLAVQSETHLRVEKIQKNIKFHPLSKRKSVQHEFK